MNNIRRFVLSIVLASLALLASAAPPPTINYQGYLTGPTGTPTNTPVMMTFKFYNAASGGAALYTEVQPSVAVINGNFNAVIGSATPITLPFDVPYWLTVTINADGEMSPRQTLASSAYAFRASTADSVASVAGNLTMVNSTDTTGNIMKGPNRFIHNFGISNTFIGVNAGNVTLTGNSNTGGGTNALASLTNGSRNTALGDTALPSNAGGSDNIAIGRDAMFANATGDLNTAIGNAALFNSSGSGNIAIGANAGLNFTNGGNNIAIGNSGVAADTTTTRIGTLQTRAFIAGVRGVAPAVNDALPVIIDSQGQLGTGVAGGGTVTSVATGAGLSGGPITTTGTIGLTATNLLPTCAATQIPKWNGSAWACAADVNALPGGTPGQVLQGTGGAPVWTASPSLAGALNFPSTTLQKLNLYGATYGIGVQSLTMYQRSDAHFAWHRLGTHSDTALDPGAGGTTLMTLSNAALATPVVGLARAQSFTNTSDRNVKEAFATVDGAKILAALVRMPMQSWKYRNEEKVRHIGPTAQDFRAAFGVGYDDKTIATVDADGVAMAAIQGLNAKVGKELAAKDALIRKQSARLEVLERELRNIKTMLGVK